MSDCWCAPTPSFAAATLTGAVSYGAQVDLLQVHSDCAVSSTISYSTGDFYSTWLEGSLDGVDWYLIGSGPSQGTAAPTAGTVTALTTYGLKPARYLRSAGTVGGGTGSPTVSTLITAR